MKMQTFNAGLDRLTRTFKNLKIDKLTKLDWKSSLKGMSDERFMFAVVRLCEDTTELYPGSNVVAMLREKAKDFREEAVNKNWFTALSWEWRLSIRDRLRKEGVVIRRAIGYWISGLSPRPVLQPTWLEIEPVGSMLLPCETARKKFMEDDEYLYDLILNFLKEHPRASEFFGGKPPPPERVSEQKRTVRDITESKHVAEVLKEVEVAS